MELIRLSDMLGFYTVQDWLHANESDSPHLCEISHTRFSKAQLPVYLYLLSMQLAPFSVISVLHQQVYYIVLGAPELHILRLFTSGAFGIRKEEWPFSTPFPSDRKVCFWSDFDVAIQKKILTTPVHSQYIYAENRQDFLDILNYFNKIRAPYS